MLRVFNQTQKMVLVPRVEKASSLFSRMKGLLGRSELTSGSGLWIERCNSIHTCFMRFSIDAIFVSPRNQVVRMFENVSPFRLTPLVWGAEAVLELPAGTIAREPTYVGDQLVLEEVSQEL